MSFHENQNTEVVYDDRAKVASVMMLRCSVAFKSLAHFRTKELSLCSKFCDFAMSLLYR